VKVKKHVMSFKLIKYLQMLSCFIMEQAYLNLSLDFWIEFISFLRVVNGKKGRIIWSKDLKL